MNELKQTVRHTLSVNDTISLDSLKIKEQFPAFLHKPDLEVTTSGYGSDAFEFAKDKPIEPLDGGQLLYLLKQTGVKARIVFPEDGKA